MFILETSDFSNFDIENCANFIRFWEKYYNYSVKKPGTTDKINYFSELNLENNLTKSNVQLLLRWKDPRMLTAHKLSGPNKGDANDQVERVLEYIDQLNAFRQDRLTQEEFRDIANRIFRQGVVWTVFLFHICKPEVYPIADQHVFRAYAYHKKGNLTESWEKYYDYMGYYNEICDHFGCNKKSGIDRLVERKRVDNALMAYGQFLKKYGVK